MADETDTPTPPATESKPAPRRRAAPRKSSASEGAKPRATRRKAADKGVVATVEEAASNAASSVKDAATSAASGAKDAVTSAAAAVKPRAGSRRGTRSTDAKKAPAKRAAAKKSDGKSEGKGGVPWGTIAAVGTVGAIGTAAALLTLRGSSGKNLGTEKKPIDISGTGDKGQGHPTSVAGGDAGGSGGAHQPDGTDSSASFQAGIADENTVPDKK